MTFIKWSPKGLWHIERADGFAVCGHVGKYVSARTQERPEPVCRGCDRMKDSHTALLRKDPT